MCHTLVLVAPDLGLPIRELPVAIESRMLTDAVPLTREITASTVHLCACMSVGSSWWL
jgi:hypothetical protein